MNQKTFFLYFANFRQVTIMSHFADFILVKIISNFLQTLGKSRLQDIFADFGQVKNFDKSPLVKYVCLDKYY